MFNSTTDVYVTKRETVHFAKSLVPNKNKVESKFVTQSIYGILRSGSVLLKHMATALNEPIRIQNTIERLSRNLQCPLSPEIEYISHLNIKITASKKPVNLVLVYGLGQTPMMLATNKPIQGKDDVVHIVRMYMSRWRIEEYFRFKKQHFSFEKFRVRSLTSINNLNQLLTYAIGLLGLLADKLSSSKLSQRLIHNARALRKDIQFYYYQLAEGILSTLAYARQGIQDWFQIRCNRPRQLALKLFS